MIVKIYWEDIICVVCPISWEEYFVWYSLLLVHPTTAPILLVWWLFWLSRTSGQVLKLRTLPGVVDLWSSGNKGLQYVDRPAKWTYIAYIVVSRCLNSYCYQWPTRSPSTHVLGRQFTPWTSRITLESPAFSRRIHLFSEQNAMNKHVLQKFDLTQACKYAHWFLDILNWCKLKTSVHYWTFLWVQVLEVPGTFPELSFWSFSANKLIIPCINYESCRAMLLAPRPRNAPLSFAPTQTVLIEK